MSSTTNVQNLLVNVFRPVYTYDIPVGGTVAVYTPKLEMSNIDIYSGNAVSVFRANVGDANSNVYVGSNAGNEPTLTRNCFRNTAVGYGAGNLISNVTNSVYLGFNAGNGAVSSSNVIAIGANAIAGGGYNIHIGQTAGGEGISNICVGHASTSTTGTSNNICIGHASTVGDSGAIRNLAIGDGASGGGYSNIVIGPSAGAGGTGSGSLSNIFIGQNTGTKSGNNNIFLGPNIAPDPAVNNQIRIGTGTLPTIAGDVNLRWAGIGGTLSPAYIGDKLDVSGNTYILGNLGINTDPRDYTLNLNGQMKADDGTGSMTVAGGLATATGGFASVRGSGLFVSGTVNIGTIKKGVIIISAVDSFSATNQAMRMVLASTTSSVTDITTAIAGGTASITFSGSNIQITDGFFGVYSWSITYLPLL